MLQNSITTRLRHERFIKKVSETSIVYGLENKEGFATSSSNDLEDEDGEPIPLICFWSEAALARSCKKDDWRDYNVVEVSLSDFLENWCIGMSNDGLLLGTNFDQNMFGYESDPLDIVIELSKELKKQKKEIMLKKYDHLDELVEQILKLKGNG
jgi:hypothetical protein